MSRVREHAPWQRVHDDTWRADWRGDRLGVRKDGYRHFTAVSNGAVVGEYPTRDLAMRRLDGARPGKAIVRTSLGRTN